MNFNNFFDCSSARATGPCASLLFSIFCDYTACSILFLSRRCSNFTFSCSFLPSRIKIYCQKIVSLTCYELIFIDLVENRCTYSSQTGKSYKTAAFRGLKTPSSSASINDPDNCRGFFIVSASE